jgi:hypothetical protein
MHDDGPAGLAVFAVVVGAGQDDASGQAALLRLDVRTVPH